MHPTLKRLIDNAAHRMGFALVPHWQRHTHGQARYLRELFALLGTDCVVDVGANQGQYGRFLRDQVRFTGRIVSFEPVPANLQALRALAGRDPAWTVHGTALGDAPGQARFNVMQDTVFSSFLQPSTSGGADLFADNVVRDTIMVEVQTLDSVLPALQAALGFKRPYLKLDTQGFDLQVLRGAEASLQRIAALQTEASVRPLYDSMPDYTVLIAHLQARGFEIGAMFAVGDAGFPFLTEFDCHMVARSAATPR